MHLSAFLIAEYKNSGVIHLDLEKAFIKNNKNLSFGVYLCFIRESVKFLNQINKQSKSTNNEFLLDSILKQALQKRN